MRTNQREGAYGISILAYVVASILVSFLFVALCQAQEASEPLRPHGIASQASRSVPHVRRVAVDDSGAIFTVPTSWTVGSKVVEVCNWSDAQALFLENVEDSLSGFMSIPITSLSVLPSKGCRSLGAQVVSVGYRVETGEADLTQTFSDITGGPLEIKVWK